MTCASIKLEKVAVLVLAALFVLDVAITVYLNLSYMYSRPTLPDAALGRIVPHNVHGAVVYVTQKEADQLRYLRWAAFGSFAGVAIAVALSERSKSKRRRR
jgi:hypothetical protein